MNIDLIINSRPEKYGVVNAPLRYSVTRKDYLYTSVNSDGGNLQITLDAALGNKTAEFTAGKLFWLHTVELSAQLEVVSTLFSSGTTKVTFDRAYEALTAGYVNDLSLLNFRIYTEVYNTANELLLALKTATYSNGNALVSVNIIKELLKPTIDGDLTNVVTDNDKLINYYVRFRPDFTGVEATAFYTDWTSDIANPRYILLAWNQAREGNSFESFVLNSESSKFLTLFDRYRITQNNPFGVSVFKDNEFENVLRVTHNSSETDIVIDADKTGVVRVPVDSSDFEVGDNVLLQVIRIVEVTSLTYIEGPDPYDFWAEVSGKPQVTLDTNYISTIAVHHVDHTTIPSIGILKIRILLNILSLSTDVRVILVLYYDGTPLYFNSAVTFQNTGLNEASYDINLAIIVGVPDQIHVQVEQLAPVGSAIVRLENLTANLFISEIKYADVVCELPNTIQLCWNNSKGGTDFYCFDYNQFLEITRTLYGYKVFVAQLFANLVSINAWRALQDLITDEQVYIKPVDLIDEEFFKERKNHQVYVIRSGVLLKAITNRLENRTETRRELHDFTVELETFIEV